MRFLCTAPHGEDDPTVKALRDEVAYLREQLAAAQQRYDRDVAAAEARVQHARDAYEHLVDARMKTQLEFLRGDVRKMAQEAGAQPAPARQQQASVEPPWITAGLAAGGHLEEDEPGRPPENYGASEEELEEATIEAEAERRERERLAAAGTVQ